MQTWAVYSLKGGVGKTTTAVNLAWEAARAGHYVLLWDLDPQAAASWYLRADADDAPRAKKLLKGKAPLGRFVSHTAYDRLDVITAHSSMRHMDRLLDGDSKPDRVLRRMIEPFGEDYSLLLLDCPPSMSRLAESILKAADLMIVPTVPTTLSLRALEQVRAFAERNDFDPGAIRPLLSLADRRKNLHKQILETDAPVLDNRLSVFISYTSDVERMGEQQAPVSCFAPRSAGARQFQALWRELSKRQNL
ncbi:MAG: chromosome partitioning protein ParA [Salinisphaeraceae bacterium]|jgi:cellulose biosynthesis protein BcsQ|nr:chromosome partitioning protein ParA [Salinisphaeraceae bacterium]